MDKAEFRTAIMSKPAVFDGREWCSGCRAYTIEPNAERFDHYIEGDRKTYCAECNAELIICCDCCTDGHIPNED